MSSYIIDATKNYANGINPTDALMYNGLLAPATQTNKFQNQWLVDVKEMATVRMIITHNICRWRMT